MDPHVEPLIQSKGIRISPSDNFWKVMRIWEYEYVMMVEYVEVEGEEVWYGIDWDEQDSE